MALLSNQTTDGTGSGVAHSDAAVVHVSGTFDGCSVSVEVSLDDTTYVKPDNTSGGGRCDAPCAILVNHVGTYYMRASVQNAGSATDVTVATTQSG